MPSYVDVVVDASLRWNVLFPGLVEAGLVKMLVRAESLSCSAGVDTTASDETIRVVFADVKGAARRTGQVEALDGLVAAHG